MRNPTRKALYFLALVTLGGLLMGFGAWRHGIVGEGWTSTGSLVVGLPAVLFGLLFLVQALFHIRGRSKLLAGKDVLARWHVGPADWDRFRAFDAARTASDTYRLVNELWIRKRTPAGGVDVIVGERSLLVDGSYHVLRPRGIPELRGIRWLTPADGSSACLEFPLVYPSKSGTVHVALRIPVPAAARGEARRVHDWFEPRVRRKPALALRSPRRTYLICLAVAVTCLAAVAGGWLQATANGFRIDEQDFMSMLPLFLMVVGTIVGAAAVILALATFFLATPGNARSAASGQRRH